MKENSIAIGITPTAKIETRLVAELKPHSANHAIYGDSIDADLLDSIKNKGILTPLIITRDNVIISGHSRWAACKEIGMTEVPIIVSNMTDELGIEEAVIIANKQRDKTTEQKTREFTHLKKIEEERAKSRMMAGVKSEDPMENFPQGSIGASRDIAAAKVGMSGKTAEKAVKVIKTIDELKAKGKDDEAAVLKQKLEKSVDGALKEVKSNSMLQELKEEAADIASDDFTITEENGLFIIKANDPDYRSVFSAANESIEWAEWAWNPVTGCLHGCDYCHAENIAEKDAKGFPRGFAPAFHPDRLNAPKNTTAATSGKKEIWAKNVLVCLGWRPVRGVDTV